MTDVPSRIGPYRVVRPIAGGGMAEVFEVEDPESGEHLALKLHTAEGGLARFNREYEAMSRLNHPNIARVYSYGVHHDKPWMTMELVDGQQVAQWLQKQGKPGSPSRMSAALRVAYDIARALDHIHRRDLIHRDLKSANVLVLADGRVKLLDFGSARIQDGAPITVEGEFIGTFAYAAPEQILGDPMDGRTDLYALGVLLYRMVTGKLPFRATEPAALARQHVKEKAAPIRDLVPSAPERLENLISRLLAKDPLARLRTGADVAEAIEAIAGVTLGLPGTLDIDTGKRLIGREAQVERLRAFLDAREPCSMIMLSGRHGSGRARLVEIAVEEARARKWQAHGASFAESGDIAAFGQLLRSMMMVCEPSVAAEIGSKLADDEATAGPRRRVVLQEATETLLRQITKKGGTPVILTFLALERASLATIDLIIRLRQTAARSGLPVMLIAEVDEAADVPGSVLRRRLPDAWRVEVPPLTPRQVSNLVGALLHRRPPPASVARRIHALSSGRPVYVEEMVDRLVRSGLLRALGNDPNRIEWAEDQIHIPAPERARADAQAAVDGLPIDARRALEAFALLQGFATDAWLAHAVAMRRTELLPILEEVQARGVIRLAPEGTVFRVHWQDAIAADMVLETLTPCRNHLLRQRLLQVVSDQPTFPGQLHLLIRAGQLTAAAARGVPWATERLTRGEPETALSVLDALAPAVAEATDLDRDLVAAVAVLHAECLLEVRPTEPSTGRAITAAVTAASGTTLERDVDLLRARVHATVGHHEAWRRQLDKCWSALVTGDGSATRPDLALRVSTDLGDAWRMAGNIAESAVWYDRAHKLAKQHDDLKGVCLTRSGIAALQLHRGRVGEAEKNARKALTLAEAEGGTGPSFAVPVLAEALRRQGRYTEALAVLRPLASALREGQLPAAYLRVLLAEGWTELDLCRFGRVQEIVDEIAATLRRGEHLHLRLEADLLRAHLLHESDEQHEARVVVESVLKRAAPAGLAVTGARATALRGAILGALGELQAALFDLDAAASALHRLGDATAYADAIVLKARAFPQAQQPREAFGPLYDMLRSEPLLPLEVERNVARVRHMESHGGEHDDATSRGRAVLDRLRVRLGDTERAALRVHRWARALRADDPIDRILQ